MRPRLLVILLALLLTGCQSPAPAPTRPPLPASAPTAGPLFDSDGGGEPRSPGYWLLWNSCAEGNQAETARANGGRAAGWILMDDLLADPGILVGALAVETCPQGVQLLQGAGAQHDAAYALAAQLLAAQLNLAAGSEYCPAADQAVSAAQLLLLGLGFDGAATYLAGPAASPNLEAAQTLIGQLASYNTGQLCR